MKNEQREYGKDFQLQGQAAVWRVASELAMRGHVPLFPGLDVGYDLVLDNGLRLQIKCGTLKYREVKYRNIGYCFNLRRGAWDSTTKRYSGTKRRSYAEVADYFVLWGIDENRFFIVPTNRKRQTIWFCHRETISKSNNRKMFEKKTTQRVAECENRWDLLDVASTSTALIESATVSEVATK